MQSLVTVEPRTTGLHRRVRTDVAALAAGTLALLLPLVVVRTAPSPAWAPRYALLGVEIAIGVPLLVVLVVRRSGARAVALLAGGFCAAAVVSTLASDNPSMALVGVQYWGTGLLFVVALACAWAIGAAAGVRGRPLVENALLIGVVANVSVACLQLFADLSQVGAPDFSGRPTGLWGQPVGLSAFLAGGLWLAARRVADGDRRMLFVVAVSALGIEIASERAALAVAAVALIVAVWRAPRPVVLRVIGVALAGFAVGWLLTSVAPSTGESASSRIGGTVAESGRVENYRAAIDAVGDRPVLGWGPGRYGAAVSPQRTLALAKASPDRYFDDAHNSVLHYAVTTGLIGVALYGAWIVLAIRRSAGPLLGFAVIIFVIQLVQPQDVGLTVLAFLALGVAGTHEREALPVAAVAAQAVLVVGGVAFASAVLVGSYHDWRARNGSSSDAFEAADAWPHWPGRAVAAAKASLATTDGTAVERVQRGAMWSERAIDRDQRDVAAATAVVGFDLLGNDDRATQEDIDHALFLDPWSPGMLSDRALLLLRQGDRAGAMMWARRALQVVPDDKVANRLLTEAISG